MSLVADWRRFANRALRELTDAHRLLTNGGSIMQAEDKIATSITDIRALAGILQRQDLTIAKLGTTTVEAVAAMQKVNQARALVAQLRGNTTGLGGFDSPEVRKFQAADRLLGEAMQLLSPRR